MRIGKIPVNVLKRSVLKEVNTLSRLNYSDTDDFEQCCMDEVINEAEVGADNALLRLKIHEDKVVNTQVYEAKSEIYASMAIYKAVNNLFCDGAVPTAVVIALTLPVEFSEQRLQCYVHAMVRTAKDLKVKIAGGDTKTFSSVTVPVITVTAIGSVADNWSKADRKIIAGQELVLSKWVGMEGAVLLANDREQELLKQYPYPMIDTVKQLAHKISVGEEAGIAIRQGVVAMHDLSDGGILAGLWEFAEYYHIGLEVDLKKIPVLQEIIEVCEYYELNPYGIRSGGALLMAVEKGNVLVQKLQEAGIQGAVIGKITNGKQRIIVNQEEQRYLDRPLADEIYKIEV